MVKISVVILNWNGLELLKKFMGSVVKYSPVELSEVVVVDNGSSDDSVLYVTENYPSVRIIQFDMNYGFTKGYNKALKFINTEYVVLLNSDVEVTNGWLMPLYNTMQCDGGIAAVMPKILSYNNKNYFEYAGAAGGMIDKYGFPYCRGRVLNKTEKDCGQWNDKSEIFWASGAAMMTRTDLYKDIGGLDDDFFAHMEEIDMCWRMKNMGYKIYVDPSSVVYHVGGGTLSNESPRKLFLNFRNSLYTLYKNLPDNRLYTIMVSRMFIDGLISVIYLLKIKPSYFFSVLKAHISFYKNINQLKDKRRQIVRSKEFPLKGMLDGSILMKKII